MIKRVFMLFILSTLFLMNASYANDNEPNIEFSEFWISEPPPVAKGTAGYGIIINNGEVADTLLHVCSKDAMVMLHKTDIKNGMAKMIHMSDTVIDSGSELKLEPMSFHLMFSDLTPKRFVAGHMITLFFEFEKAGTITVDVPVRSAW